MNEWSKEMDKRKKKESYEWKEEGKRGMNELKEGKEVINEKRN